MKPIPLYRTLALAYALFASGLAAQAFPLLKGECLNGRQATLPAETKGKATLLIFTFSRAASEPAARWGKKLEADFKGDSRVAVYQIAQIESAPRLVRPMILRAMRKKTAPEIQDKFLVLREGGDFWKHQLDFDPKFEDEPWLLLLNKNGGPVWARHGDFDPKMAEELYKKLGQEAGVF